MHKTKISIICIYKGVLENRRTFLGVHIIKKGDIMEEDNSLYILDNDKKYKEEFELDESYKLDGYLFLNSDCKMSLDIRESNRIVNPMTGKSPYI